MDSIANCRQRIERRLECRLVTRKVDKPRMALIMVTCTHLRPCSSSTRYLAILGLRFSIGESSANHYLGLLAGSIRRSVLSRMM